MKLYIVSICLLVAVQAVLGHESHKARIDIIGEPAHLNCSTDLDKIGKVDYWLIPNGGGHVIAKAGYENNGARVTSDGWSVIIDRALDDHLGLYLCRTELSGEPEYTETELFLYIPTFLEVYETNLIVGASAAAAVLGLTSLICIIHSCRYSQRQRDKEYKQRQKSFSDPYNTDTYHSAGIEAHQSTLDRHEYPNSAYENVEIDEIKKTPHNGYEAAANVDEIKRAPVDDAASLEKEAIPDTDGITTM